MQAIKKLKEEIQKNSNNSYIQVVGNFLIGYLEQNPESAKSVLAEDKTIAKSLDEMRKEAEKKKVGNCAVLTDQEGFDVVLKYFGITSKESSPKEEEPIKETDDEIDLEFEDLLK